MKWIIIPILFLGVFAQTFNKWIVIIDFTINQKVIAKELCENKSRPEMHCNGKCQFKKRVAQTEDESSQVQQYCQYSDYFVTAPVTDCCIQHVAYYQLPQLKAIGRTCFHPPQQV
jgi:hypothetical protein